MINNVDKNKIVQEIQKNPVNFRRKTELEIKVWRE